MLVPSKIRGGRDSCKTHREKLNSPCEAKCLATMMMRAWLSRRPDEFQNIISFSARTAVTTPRRAREGATTPPRPYPGVSGATRASKRTTTTTTAASYSTTDTRGRESRDRLANRAGVYLSFLFLRPPVRITCSRIAAFVLDSCVRREANEIVTTFPRAHRHHCVYIYVCINITTTNAPT